MGPFRFTRSLQTESASQKQDYVRLTKNSAENLSTQSLALGSFLAGATNDGNLPGLASGALAPSSCKPFTPGMKYRSLITLTNDVVWAYPTPPAYLGARPRLHVSNSSAKSPGRENPELSSLKATKKFPRAPWSNLSN